ncbi:hypothetical protein GCM10007989_27480 [Devosia pacifica]|uniref:Cell wall hydrolase SleB domain-containing protein n=1 Tax=Devosia pacifica TaxID=1335967 RepID=A0A918VWN2_9HYPH|nr:cell wall hydrolase [Devosia pacifica]GHA30266.1 hypothetical protein GCM10007989_27480 [Devosia pacifica]
MAKKSRSAALGRTDRPLRKRHSLTGVFFVAVLAVGGYLSSAGSALGPASELQVAELPQVEQPRTAIASLSYSGRDTIITGSVGHLFTSGSFVGPNRAEKTDRFKPVVEIADFARGFEDVRLRLAALRTAREDSVALAQSAVEVPATDDNAQADEPRISIAAIDTSKGAAALDAIRQAARDPDMPLPTIASEQLAYARANEPASDGYLTSEAMNVGEKEMWCLATAIYFEARGEIYRGQVAVAQVVLNRVKDRRYPSTICGVVFQNQHRRNACQFSFACDGIPETINDRKSWTQAEEIAEKVVNGELYLAEVNDATHYHATYVRPAWAPRMNKVTQIGLHVFYKFKSGWLFG